MLTNDSWGKNYQNPKPQIDGLEYWHTTQSEKFVTIKTQYLINLHIKKC